MKSYVITIMDMEKSVKAAEKCIQSAAEYGVTVEMFPAITPKDDPSRMMEERNIPTIGFNEKWSRTERCMAAFLSHYSLWKKCEEEKDQSYLILEHDAVFEGNIPNISMLEVNTEPLLVSLGEPSYGSYKTPSTIGLNKLQSKHYLPGAHAYMINYKAAHQLVGRAKNDPAPTDVFIDNRRFYFLHEWSPFPITVKDTFTTIQREIGCTHKHSYKKVMGTGKGKYDII